MGYGSIAGPASARPVPATRERSSGTPGPGPTLPFVPLPGELQHAMPWQGTALAAMAL